MRQRRNAVFGKVDRDIFGAHQRRVLQGQRVVGLGQNAHEIGLGQRPQFHPDRQPPLKFGQQIRRLGDVKRTRGDEQDMVGLDRPVFGADGGAFDQRQKIALNPLAADICPARLGPHADLVDLVEKDDAVLGGRLKGGPRHRLVIQQLVSLFADQQVIAFRHGHLAPHRAPAHGLAQNIAQVHHAHLAARLPGDVQHAHRV